jgi:vacuolar protein sorting-associated protein VTA1
MLCFWNFDGSDRSHRQTAGTFDAAATFFNLVHIWGAPDQENLQKIKYAKWNAARIFKAIKEGADPNESNPKQEDIPPPEAALTLDPKDPEVQLLASAGPRPAAVEDAPDSDGRRDSAGVSLPQSPASAAHHPAPSEPTLPDIPPTAPGAGHAGTPPPHQPGYFDNHSMPRIPSPLSPPAQPSPHYQASAPQPPQGWVPTPSPPANQPAFLPPPPPTQPAFSPTQQQQTFSPPPVQYHQPPPVQPQHPVAPAPPTFAPSPQPTYAAAPPSLTSTPNPAYPGGVGHPAVSAPAAPAVNRGYVVPVRVDEKAMTEAQKHAKWAISALNFEDVPTAVKELRKALETLGAS